MQNYPICKKKKTIQPQTRSNFLYKHDLYITGNYLHSDNDFKHHSRKYSQMDNPDTISDAHTNPNGSQITNILVQKKQAALRKYELEFSFVYQLKRMEK